MATGRAADLLAVCWPSRDGRRRWLALRDPASYACIDNEIWVHNTAARGHLRANAEHDARVCLEGGVDVGSNRDVCGAWPALCAHTTQIVNDYYRNTFQINPAAN